MVGHRFAIGDVEIRSREGGQPMPPKRSLQVVPQLAVRSEQRNLHGGPLLITSKDGSDSADGLFHTIE